MASFGLGGDKKRQPGRTFSGTAFESIFHQRLKDKTRYQNSACGGRGCDSGLEFLSKTGFLNPQIGGRGIEFNGQGGDQFVPVIQGVFQIGGEFIHHDGGDPRVGRDFRGDPIEGVEKEMWIKLEADELQFHLLHFGFGFQLLDFFLLNEELCFEPKIGERPG